ncbi:MAG: calcium-binding protein, partial [Selenomonadaceae bacterium]|nr:calcium-binding protein [Selenomonadaceae bacterium]
MADSNKDDLLIAGTDEAELINNTLNAATITAQGGNDTVTNSGVNVSIDAGADNDSISNTSYAIDSTLEGGDGNDTVKNSAQYVTISGGAGNDSVGNSGANVSIDGGEGADTVNNSASNVTIGGGAGNDSIWNSGSRSVIDGGDDDDRLLNPSLGSDSTIIGGAGNDLVVSKAARVLIDTGDGDDTVALSDNYSAFGEQILGSGYFNNSTVLTGKGNDYVNFYESNEGRGSGVLINTGDGSDTVGGTGGADSLTIDGGAGQDSIYNYQGHYSSLVGGTGNDTIRNESSNYVTISGGADSDFIFSSGSNILFKYNNGDGNDVIEGFNETSTLEIGSGSCSSTKNSNNLIITVGNGNITLVGAANLSTININYSDAPTWSLDGTTATYGKLNDILITITGLKSTDGITINDNVVTLTESNLGTETVTISGEGYTLALSGVAEPATNGARFDGLTYKTSGTTAGYTLSEDKKSVTYTAANSASDLFTLSGVKNTDGITVNGKVVTLTAKNLGTENVTISGDGYTLALSGVAEPTA